MIHLFIMLSLAAGAPQQGVQLSESQSKAVRAYAHELVKLRSRSQGAEDLSAGDFAKLEHTLSGIILNRGEVILAEPDPHFFSELSSEYGGFVDRSFFELFSKTYPDGVWPVYLTQQTDYSGCTEFGEGHLVRSYREWSRFRTSHPLRYQREVKRIIDQIQEQIVSTCACGDRDSVLRELREFAAAFPKSPVHKAVKDRIKELEEGSSDVRFQCISG